MAERLTSFSKQMRMATRDVHKISDGLVNAKLAFALSDNNVWADGLLVFYEIFRYLEDHVPENILPILFHRTDAFEKDLAFYLGREWKKSYKIRKCVQNYLNHLKQINESQPILLYAYVYHLYMGLLSGGQILKAKRKIFNTLNPLSQGDNIEGYAVTNFGDTTITDLKYQMRSLIDHLATSFDENTKELLIEESKRVFELNNTIIASVRGVSKANLKKFSVILIVILLLCCILYWLKK